MRLLITGGGTGGHVYPLLAVLQSLVAGHALDAKNEVLYLGRTDSIERRIASNEGIPFDEIRVSGLRTLAPWSVAKSLALLVSARGKSQRILNNFRAQVVLATGGYVSAPVIWAAAQSGIPVLIYLPDLEPGWAIRLMSRWAKLVAVSFDQVKSYFPTGKAVVTGYPVRSDFIRVTKLESRAHFSLDPALKVLTVFGGSQGAHTINEAVRENLAGLLEIAQIIHISGVQEEGILQGHRAVLDEKLRTRYHLFKYLDQDMPMALAAADLVVARAGAATLGEFPAVGVPSVLVPYPYAGKHQEKNAAFLVSHGAAVTVGDDALHRELVPTVAGLLADGVRLERMQSNARSLAHPDAAARIGKLLVEMAA